GALERGIGDVTGTATPYLIQAVLKGSDAVAVIGGPANAVYSLIAKAEFGDVASLRGRLVAMSTPADTISLATRLLLAKHGLREGDYRSKELVGSGARANCLVSGECDAVPLGQPEDVVLVQKGFRRLGVSLDVLPVQQFNVLAARRAWQPRTRIRSSGWRAPMGRRSDSCAIAPIAGRLRASSSMPRACRPMPR